MQKTTKQIYWGLGEPSSEWSPTPLHLPCQNRSMSTAEKKGVFEIYTCNNISWREGPSKNRRLRTHLDHFNCSKLWPCRSAQIWNPFCLPSFLLSEIGSMDITEVRNIRRIIYPDNDLSSAIVHSRIDLLMRNSTSTNKGICGKWVIAKQVWSLAQTIYSFFLRSVEANRRGELIEIRVPLNFWTP